MPDATRTQMPPGLARPPPIPGVPSARPASKARLLLREVDRDKTVKKINVFQTTVSTAAKPSL